MEFINKGHLGSAAFFQKEFIHPIEKAKDEGKMAELKSLVNPFLLRRTKEEVAKDLPELEVQVFYTEMTESQKKIYETEKSKARNLLLKNYQTGSFEYVSIVLRTLLKLRQIANHPRLAESKYALSSGKFEDVTTQLNNLWKSDC